MTSPAEKPSSTFPSRLVAVGLGSNIENAEEILRATLKHLAEQHFLELEAISRLRRTRPIGGPAGQLPYMNAVALLRTTLSPQAIWDVLRAVEDRFGRTRETRWGPRSLDLDILLDEAGPVCEDGLYVPHPRLAARRFFLEALAELRPQCWHFWSGLSIGRILNILREAPRWIIVIPETFPGPRAVTSSAAGLTDTAASPTDLTSPPKSANLEEENSFLLRLTVNGPLTALPSDLSLGLPQRLGLEPVDEERVILWWKELEHQLREGQNVATALPPTISTWRGHVRSASSQAAPNVFDSLLAATPPKRDSRANRDSPERGIVLRPRLVILGPLAARWEFWSSDFPTETAASSHSEDGFLHQALLIRVRQGTPVVLVETSDPKEWPDHVRTALEATEEVGTLVS
ncbi:2-amino-4-hydroxy-6-hydroxymethyldihydropteridine diphosphokinase [Thermogutta sp.]|uniref:2-amino-4-hydroxy-6- hydroxymethyldihydropteridine diphosphokinase n=1 Tax=Thermogutta sp. TaxID=1962930 RepID=UPI00321F893F